MIRSKAFTAGETPIPDMPSDGEDKLILIDDAMFVSTFAEAIRRRGKKLVCVRCLDPARALRAVLLLLDGRNTVDESAGSLGFCSECYRDLAELMFHDAVLRASKPNDS